MSVSNIGWQVAQLPNDAVVQTLLGAGRYFAGWDIFLPENTRFIGIYDQNIQATWSDQNGQYTEFGVWVPSLNQAADPLGSWPMTFRFWNAPDNTPVVGQCTYMFATYLPGE